MSAQCSVVTMVREPLETTLNFVAWYLGLGAAKIIICFDDPDDPALPVLRDMQLDRLELHACTPEFWQALRIRPGNVMKRQKAVFSWAYGMVETPWLLVVDGDEYLWLGGRSLDDFAASVPEAMPAVRFSPAEPVRSEAPGGWFRTAVAADLLAPVYGDDTKFFARRGGLLGHPEGKSMTRTGVAARMRLHWAETAGGAQVNGLFAGPEQGAFLLHYFDNGYEDWRRKLDWRKSTWGFAKAVSGYLDAYDEAGLQALYTRLNSLDSGQHEALQAIGGLHRLDIDLAATRRSVLGR